MKSLVNFFYACNVIHLKTAAIAEEKKRQREGLKKQRDQYISRSEKMKRELKMLKEQKSGFLDGLGKRSPSPKTSGFIKENDKLQVMYRAIERVLIIFCVEFCLKLHMIQRAIISLDRLKFNEKKKNLYLNLRLSNSSLLLYKRNAFLSFLVGFNENL